PKRIVERKKARLRLLVDLAAILALETLAENEPFRHGWSSITRRRGSRRGRDKLQNGLALTVTVAEFDRINQTRANLRPDGKAIDQDEDRAGEVGIQQRLRRREFEDAAILIDAVEAALLEIAERLLHGLGRRPAMFGCTRLFGRFGQHEAEQHVKAAAGL